MLLNALTILNKLDDDHRAIHANGDALAVRVMMDLVTDEHTLLAVLLLISPSYSHTSRDMICDDADVRERPAAKKPRFAFVP
jgi:hypothetical protein